MPLYEAVAGRVASLRRGVSVGIPWRSGQRTEVQRMHCSDEGDDGREFHAVVAAVQVCIPPEKGWSSASSSKTHTPSSTVASEIDKCILSSEADISLRTRHVGSQAVSWRRYRHRGSAKARAGSSSQGESTLNHSEGAESTQSVTCRSDSRQHRHARDIDIYGSFDGFGDWLREGCPQLR